MNNTKRCTSCQKYIVNATVEKGGAVIYPCPRCGTEMVRCSACRANSIPISCPNEKCDFTGP